MALAKAEVDLFANVRFTSLSHVTRDPGSTSVDRNLIKIQNNSQHHIQRSLGDSFSQLESESYPKEIETRP